MDQKEWQKPNLILFKLYTGRMVTEITGNFKMGTDTKKANLFGAV